MEISRSTAIRTFTSEPTTISSGPVTTSTVCTGARRPRRCQIPCRAFLSFETARKATPATYVSCGIRCQSGTAWPRYPILGCNTECEIHQICLVAQSLICSASTMGHVQRGVGRETLSRRPAISYRTTTCFCAFGAFGRLLLSFFASPDRQ